MRVLTVYVARGRGWEGWGMWWGGGEVGLKGFRVGEQMGEGFAWGSWEDRGLSASSRGSQ